MTAANCEHISLMSTASSSVDHGDDPPTRSFTFDEEDFEVSEANQFSDGRANTFRITVRAFISTTTPVSQAFMARSLHAGDQRYQERGW
jgi:hypothetical protein